jgi:hypothetical protein
MKKHQKSPFYMKYLRQIAISAVSVFVIVAFIFLVMVILPLMGVDTKAG